MKETYQPTNREKSITAKKTKVWCFCCDGALVAEWGKDRKCKQCGNISKYYNKRKIKNN